MTIHTHDNNGDEPRDANSAEDIDKAAEQIEELLTEESATASGSAAEAIKQTARGAATAVEYLNIKKFLGDHGETIYSRLEECESYAKKADFNNDMMFIALALPVINGIIHVASTRGDLSRATEWVVREWSIGPKEPIPEKVPILSALTLIYIVAMGWKTYNRQAGKGEIWESIRDRVQKLSTEPLEQVAP